MPRKTFTLEIVTPDRIVISDDKVVSLTAPGSEGYLGVLANHSPLITEITIGALEVQRADEEVVWIASTHGFMEVSDNKATILADAAERADEIDVERARQALARAMDRLTAQEESLDVPRAQAAIERANNRLHVANRAH